MADLGRKDFGDKAQEKLTPQSEKSIVDKATEGATDAYDKAAGAVQPEGDKSISQQASDAIGGSAKPGEKGYVEQAQDAVNTGVKYVQGTVNGKSQFTLFRKLQAAVATPLTDTGGRFDQQGLRTIQVDIHQRPARITVGNKHTKLRLS